MLWDLAKADFIVSFAFVCAIAFVCGWIADRALGYSGFGVIGNWLLLLTGAYVGLYAYNLYGYRFDWSAIMTIGVAAGGGAVMLLLLASVKSATHT